MTRRTARLRTPSDIGLALQQARLAREISQSELATELGMPQSTVSQMESGSGTIYVRRLLDLADALGLELSASWTDEASDAPRG